jgi:hypothetical protein
VIDWRPRGAPLEARAVFALGPDLRRALLERLLLRSDDELRALAGVVSEELVVLLGEPSSLPWVDGVGYLGADPLAPSLLLPTALEPEVPVVLFERALLAAPSTSALGRPIGVIPERGVVADLGGALPVERDRLRAWASK